MTNDPHAAHWAAIAEAAERISASEHCGPEQAADFCRAIDRLSVALQGEILQEPRVPRPPTYWGFVDESECRIDLCFTPNSPNDKGRFAIPLWGLAQPLEEDEVPLKIAELRRLLEKAMEDAQSWRSEVEKVEAQERARMDKALQQTWRLIDPLHPAGQPGSYARGFDIGVTTALNTLRDNLERTA